MSHHPLLNEHVLNLLPSKIDGLVILDVGCGYGEWGFFIRTRKVGLPYMIGADIWRPHLERLCPLGIYEGLAEALLLFHLQWVGLRRKFMETLMKAISVNGSQKSLKILVIR
jgi:SAM-dependent methyltransferase